MRLGGQKVPLLTLVLVISESFLVLASLLFAFWLRYGSLPNSTFTLPAVLFRCAFLALVWELALYYYDLYDLSVVRRRAVLFINLLQSFGVACLVIALAYFLVPSLSVGRGIAAIAAFIVLAVILSWRLLLDTTLPLVRRADRVLVLGTGALGISVVKEMLSRQEFGFEVVGFLDEKGENIGKRLVNPGIVGGLADLGDIVSREHVGHVVVSLTERRQMMPVRELLKLKLRGIRVEDAHTIYERLTGRIMLAQLNPSWLILSDGFRKSRLLTGTKRTVDIAIVLLALILTAPVMLLVALAIWFETGFPVLFRQERVGLWGREFEMLKFRSMFHNSGDQPSWTRDADQRITRVGRFIRKYRLDELPQMFNVLAGHMSIVGPRPEQPFFCEMLDQQIPWYVYRHAVRPGITGWAQIKYGYGGNIEQNTTKLEYDLFYVKHCSLLLDLAIIFETGKVLFSGRGAK